MPRPKFADNRGRNRTSARLPILVPSQLLRFRSWRDGKCDLPIAGAPLLGVYPHSRAAVVLAWL